MIAINKVSNHLRVDHLSKITSGEAPIVVDDDLLNTTLFKVEIAPRWAWSIASFISLGCLLNEDSFAKLLAIIEDSAPHQLVARRLYRMGWDGVMCLCPDPSEYEDILELVHGWYHYFGKETSKRAKFKGYWWHNLHQNIVDFVKHFPVCNWKELPMFSSLFSIQKTQKWSYYIEEYLWCGHKDKDLPKHCKKMIDVEVEAFVLIADQLFKRYRDENLRLCVYDMSYDLHSFKSF